MIRMRYLLCVTSQLPRTTVSAAYLILCDGQTIFPLESSCQAASERECVRSSPKTCSKTSVGVLSMLELDEVETSCTPVPSKRVTV